MAIMDTTISSELNNLEDFTHQLRGELGAAFSAGESKWVAWAARALDCMGGFAEYGGSLTLTLPTAEAVYTAVQPRHDQTVQVNLLMDDRNGHPAVGTFPLALWYEGGDLVDPTTFARRVEESGAGWAKPVMGVLYTLLSEGHAPHWRGGLTLAVARPAPWETDPVLASAATVATMAAVCRCVALELPPVEMALLCQKAQNDVTGTPCGPSSAACALLGEAGTLLQLLCQPLEVVGRLTLPERVTFWGIDCGARHPAAERKYRQARTAAFMGRRIIERVLAIQDRSIGWNGYLAQVSVSDYVDHLRDRLPTKMKGGDFLQRFGPPADPLSLVEPTAVYKVRSRTEHHIYENMRVHQFAERLARAQRTGESGPLLDAGELMFASHWSYGQRCGLGSIETDKLVNILRRRGPQGGIFGAKICGPGAGGTVVVLLSDTDAAHQAVRESVAEYAQATGLRPRLLVGAAPGAPSCGIRQVT